VTAYQLSHRVHVLARREDIDTVRMPGKVAIVLDVLFATSTIVTALAHGAPRVIPRADERAARDEAARHPEGSYVLAGELLAETLPGFAPPLPLALVEHGVDGRSVIYSTTNGTVALGDASAADHVYAASLLNGAATVDHVLVAHPERTLLVICSGSMGNFNLEDFYGAGYLVDLLAHRLGEGADFSDAARAARALFRSGDPAPTLAACRVGRMMAARGLAHEVEYSARLSALDVVAALRGGEVVRV
jgi:2-phosphosulfolactate phosphatase